ncbi:WASH complex subunit 3 isoform X2 [Stigmatopora argus]
MVPAIQQRRMVAFLNQFIVHTVRFLNNFSTVCEEKLANISLRIQQIETTLCILEAKLSSIPGLEGVTVDAVRYPQNFQTNEPVASIPGQTDCPAIVLLPPLKAPKSTLDNTPKVEEANVMTVAKDPRYAKYLKMIHVGVPVMAIRNKMITEGLDPDMLDKPDVPMPGVGGKNSEEPDNTDSESSFSD